MPELILTCLGCTHCKVKGGILLYCSLGRWENGNGEQRRFLLEGSKNNGYLKKAAEECNLYDGEEE